MKPYFSIYSIYFEEGLKTLNFTRRKLEQVLQLYTLYTRLLFRVTFSLRPGEMNLPPPPPWWLICTLHVYVTHLTSRGVSYCKA